MQEDNSENHGERMDRRRFLTVAIAGAGGLLAAAAPAALLPDAPVESHETAASSAALSDREAEYCRPLCRRDLAG